MARSLATAADDALPALPLSAAHWQAIVDELGLSARQAQVAELMVRGAPLKGIAITLGISISTVRTQQERIFDKSGTSGRGELLLHILGLSHRVGCCRCRQ